DCCGGSSDQECSEIYHGAGPASEPETQAVIDYVSSIIPDQREDPITATAPLTTTGSFLDLHSSGGFVLWPWGFTADPAPNGTQLQTLGRRYANFNDYHPEQSSTGLYFTDGTTKDWAYGELGIPGYTIELGTEFFEQCNVFEGIILPDNLPMLLYAAQTARTPYLLSSGPEALDVELSDTTIAPGEPVTVMAEINDTRFNNSNGTEPTQPIAEAGYYIDVPPWSEEPAPVAYPMEPADGTFDSPVEDATAEIDTTELAVGRHMIYVRGRDTSDTWGAVGAAFLFVIDPEVSPTIQGYVREAGSGAPLAATVSANGLFQTTTDPATGYYQMQVISDTYDLTATAPDHAAQTVQDVVAHDFQTVEQDFSLAPICAAFADDVEAGNSGWTAEAPWAITEETAHSPTHSWTDSPGSLYANNVNVALTSPLLDLTDYEATTLTFWQICDTEAGYDYCHVELSADGGATWSEVALYDGAQSAWEEVSLAVPVLDGQPDARVRFRLSSDFTITGDGWHVDDIRLLGTGAGCVPPPTAVTVEMLAAASNGGRGLLIALGTLGLCALAGARVTRRRRARRV
ncbi:MAG: M14 family zinc carboxypeptidase, partial [Ardenticatenaceae bacterium]